MNELAITLHQHGKHEGALTYYKKALLCMKRRHKNKYIMEPETAAIIINIATLYYITKDFKESAVYYQHALEVLYRGHNRDDESYLEIGKVHMSLANINRCLGNSIESRT